MSDSADARRGARAGASGGVPPPPQERSGGPGGNCVFCAIIRGELPTTMILETEHLLAFLDHRPLFRGHTLLVPKRHMRLLSDLPADLATEFLTTAQRLERAIEDGLGVSGTMILVNNVVSQSVPHLHMHVIPREFKDGLRFWLGPRHPYNDENPAQAYADKITRFLGDTEFSGGYEPIPQAPAQSGDSVPSLTPLAPGSHNPLPGEQPASGRLRDQDPRSPGNSQPPAG